MKIEIENRLDAIASCLEHLETYLKQRGVARNMRFVMRLCLEELLVNTIRYGYPAGQRGKIRIILRGGPALLVEITDDAIPFDPLREAPEINRRAPPAERVGGLGIFFLRHFCDEIRYTRLAGGNRITLKKHLGSKPGMGTDHGN